ncbi:MAG: XRE family transcriptional regulator [Lachnospiraceae bacterium]
MAFKDRLKEARLTKGLTQEQIAEKIGVAKSTFTGYEKGNSEPNMLTVSKIMKELQVDANYLYQDEMGSNYPMKVSYDEYQHIEKYRNLDSHGRKMVDFTLQEEWERSINEKENAPKAVAPTRVLSYYYRLASAGTGQILFDMPPTKRIEIPDIPEYRKADYAIGVNGDSMEPVYHDGDMLIVEMTDEIRVGEIGIFSLNGECYVKKLGKGELISLNPKYDNIPLNETAKCMGRVIDKLN